MITPGTTARLVDAVTGAELAGTRLVAAVDAVAGALDRAPAGFVVCLVGNDLAGVVRYLGAARSGRPVLLWGREAAVDPVTRFRPAVVLGVDAATPPGSGYRATDLGAAGPAWLAPGPAEVPPHADLSVLLGTSGSTGAPRLVRHSAAGVQTATAAVCESLHIGPDDVAVTTLPPHYTYGLSVLHSHLHAGATVVLDRRGVMDRGFWLDVDRHRVTTIAGVPHTFELLARLPWTPERSPTVRLVTVSGGRLRDELVLAFHAAVTAHGGRFHVMYGQTEAGPRIAVLPSDRLPAKLGSVGPPVPRSRVSIKADPDGPDGTGEVVFHSPAVMMGYAETAADLARGDDLGGVLHTGDGGRLDEDGYLWIGGRLGRIGKAFGVRVNLDAVEHLVAHLVPAAAVPGDDRVRIWCEGADRAVLAEVVRVVTTALGLHRLGVLAESVDRLPRRPTGKIDYRAIPPGGRS